MATLTFLHTTLFLAIFSASIQAQSNQINSRNLDETPPFENKCGDCPCDKPCVPPPSPPPPSPPPPSPPPPSSPPPSSPPPNNVNCPPPPSKPSSPSGDKPPNTPYIYVNGPPGNVYSVYPYYSGGGRPAFTVFFTVLIGGAVWALRF